MRSGFNNGAVFKDDDAVGLYHSCQAVGDHKGCPVFCEPFQRVLDLPERVDPLLVEPVLKPLYAAYSALTRARASRLAAIESWCGPPFAAAVDGELALVSTNATTIRR